MNIKMARRQSVRDQNTNKNSGNGTVAGSAANPAKSALGVPPVRLDELNPLERRRLDTAVMMLVDYLVSTSQKADKTML